MNYDVLKSVLMKVWDFRLTKNIVDYVHSH